MPNAAPTIHTLALPFAQVWQWTEWELIALAVAEQKQIMRASGKILQYISSMRGRPWLQKTPSQQDWGGSRQPRLLCNGRPKRTGAPRGD